MTGPVRQGAARRHLAGLAVALAAACALAAPVAAAAAEPVRVATLLPYVAEALDGLGQATVVASIARPGQALPDGVVDLGDPHSPSFEKLAAARPDVVVADRRLHALLAGKLGRGGADLVMVEAASVEATFQGLERVGERVGAGAEMRRRIAAARAEIESLRSAEPVGVLPLFGAPGSFMAITGSTWLGDLVGEVGLRNLAAEVAGRESFPGYVELSDEVLATLRPDVVLLVTHGAPEAVEEAIGQRAAAGGVWAGVARRTRVLEPDLFASNPGLRMPEAARRLTELARTEGAAPAR